MIFSAEFLSGKVCFWFCRVVAVCSLVGVFGLASADFLYSSDADLPNVVVISTGGTIAEKIDPETGGAVPALSGKELVAAVPGLAEVADISVHQLCNMDSSQMSPEIWLKLSRKVNDSLADENVDGVVVTHGTDTMAEGAYFLDLTTGSEKPVVFTGAMNDASSPFPDGPGNLMNAVIQAASADARGWGVTVTLNRYINSARAVRKTQTTNMQTFMSGEKGYLGYISGKNIYRINERAHRQYLPLPAKLPKVFYLSTYAGDDGSLVRYAVDSGVEGVIIDGVGAGNVNEAVYEAVKYGLSKKVAVVISSTVYYGAVEPVYGGPGGGKTLSDAGCIFAGNLKGHKARLLLMLGLATYGNDFDKLKDLFEN